MRRLRTAAALCLVGIAGAAPAQEFRVVDPTLGAGSPQRKSPHDSPPFSHWDLREAPNCRIPWAYGTGPVHDLDGDLIPGTAADLALAVATFEEAFGVWEGATGQILFQRADPNPPIPAGDVIDSVNTLGFNVIGSPGLNAYTLIRADAVSGRIQEADIVFNASTANAPDYGRRIWVLEPHGTPLAADVDNIPTGNWPNPGDGDTDVDGDGIQEYEVDLQTIAIHEIGHFLGLHHIQPVGFHNDPDNALMEEIWNPDLGPDGGGWSNRVLKAPDLDGCGFLYSPDLGDATDPSGAIGFYPSLVHEQGTGRPLNGIVMDGILTGAVHVLGIKPRQPLRNFTYEWLGDFGVDAECETANLDRDFFDDGVTYFPNPPVWRRNLIVTAWVWYANDAYGNGHAYAADSLWVNGWLDLNQDRVWSEAERFMVRSLAPPPLAGPNAIAPRPVSGSITLPPTLNQPRSPLWLRVRLDWGENASDADTIDGTLDGPKGAAQFGEVEDHKFDCTVYYSQSSHTNLTGLDRAGVATVFTGPSPAITTFGAEVDAGDCVLALLDPPLETYDGIADEATIGYDAGGLLGPGRHVHTGSFHDAGPRAPLRKHWIPPGGAPPDTVDQIPTCIYGAGLAGDRLTVKVGVPDAGTGGMIAGSAGAWNDSALVDVAYRRSPFELSLASLSPCDPVYASLPRVAVGSGWIDPEHPFEFDLTVPHDLDPAEFLIVEAAVSWSINANVSNEIIQFADLFPENLDSRTPPVANRLVLGAFPNPSAPPTAIHYALPVPAAVSVRIHDVSGRVVRTLAEHEPRPEGAHRLRWDGRDDAGRPVPSGIYLVHLRAGRETATGRMVVVR